MKTDPKQETEIPTCVNTFKLQGQEFQEYVDVSKFTGFNWRILLGMTQKLWIKKERELTY